MLKGVIFDLDGTLIEGGAQLMPGVLDFLRVLYDAGLPMAVGTSMSRDAMHMTLEGFDLEKFFSVQVSVDDVRQGKPSPDIFLHAAKLMKVLPEECIVFEDSHAGSLAAKRAEMVCVGYTQNNKNPEDLSNADLKVADFSTLSIEQLQQLF